MRAIDSLRGFQTTSFLKSLSRYATPKCIFYRDAYMLSS